MVATDKFGEVLHRVSSGINRRFRKNSLLSPSARALHDRLVGLDPKRLAARSVEDARFVVIDTETTGLQCYGGDEIVSIAMLELEGLELTSREYVRLVNPGRPIPEPNSEIHGIYDKDVRDAPGIDQIIGDVVNFIGDGILVGHHVNFDIRFLNKSVQKHLLCTLRNPWLDTMLLYLAHTGRMGHCTLEEVAGYCRVPIRERHTARGDALAASDVFTCLARNLHSETESVDQLIRHQYAVEEVHHV
jgi:DNA polymerase-3 subunit epsilon